MPVKKDPEITTSSLPKSDPELLKTENERLLTVLHSLEDLITRQTSLRFAFLRGAIYGVGTIIGATVLIALLGGALAATINSLAEIPFVGQFINDRATGYLNIVPAEI